MDATAAGARSPAADGPRLKRRPPIASKAALLRISEASALQVADVEADRRRQHRDHPGSKTDQQGDGAVRFLGAPTVAAVRCYLDARLADGCTPTVEPCEPAGERPTRQGPPARPPGTPAPASRPPAEGD